MGTLKVSRFIASSCFPKGVALAETRICNGRKPRPNCGLQRHKNVFPETFDMSLSSFEMNEMVIPQ